MSFTTYKSSFQPVKHDTCKSRNVIYCIRCTKCCKPVYVGQTERELLERMVEHVRDVRMQKDRPIIQHFDASHDVSSVQFSVLEIVHEDSLTSRIIREAMWIKQLCTVRPGGCNVKDTSAPKRFRY